MIASLDSRTAPFERLNSRYVRFLDVLRARGFEGEIAPDYANRTVLGLGCSTAGDILGLSPNNSDNPDDWSHT